MSFEHFLSANGSCNYNASDIADALAEVTAVSNMSSDGPEVVIAMMTYTRKGSKVSSGATLPPGGNVFTAAGAERNINGTRVLDPAAVPELERERYHGGSSRKHYEEWKATAFCGI